MKIGIRQIGYVLSSISILFIIFLLYGYFNSTSMSIVKQAVDLEKKKPVIAFTNVNIITMHNEEILKNKTVIIKDGIIHAIGDSEKSAIPNDSIKIDGTDKYLIPGLIDMHVHIWAENDILLFLANGITTLRNMDALPWWAKFGGYAEHLSLRNDINSGKVIGPTIYTTGRYFDGNPPEWGKSPSTKIIDNTDSAKKEVKNDKKKGYDYIKVYGNLSLEVYNSILKQANEEDIKAVGHVPHSVDFPGFSYIKELENLVGAGLTNYEVLKAGTRDAAECLGSLDKTGTIEIGKKADLVLLEDNPLEDISHIDKKAGVVNHGIWITQNEISKILEHIAVSNLSN